MIWDPTLETGIESIDDQHKELFERVETLLYQKEGESIEDTLRFIESYAAAHFKTEEAMMRDLDYPEYASHKKLHDDNVTLFSNFRSMYDQENGSLPITLAIYHSVVDWIKRHIMGADMHFAVYCRAMQSKRGQMGL